MFSLTDTYALFLSQPDVLAFLFQRQHAGHTYNTKAYPNIIEYTFFGDRELVIL